MPRSAKTVRADATPPPRPASPRPSSRAVAAPTSTPTDAPVRTGATRVPVGPDADGQRIDNFLLKQLPGVPKSAVYRWLRSGQVRVDGGRAKPERKLALGEEVRIPPVELAPAGTPVRPPDRVLAELREAVIFEDEHYLAIAKPSGLASHGGTGAPYGVIEAARAWQRYDYLELCHRLDRDTSGVLLLAKTRPGLLRAQRAFRHGTATKRYFALLEGRLTGDTRDVAGGLVRDLRVAGGERRVRVAGPDEGDDARSRFTVRARYRPATLCEVDIFSGRTHQIRVHAQSLGHPVAGDRKYGDDHTPAARLLRDKGLKRLFLHSHLLRLAPDEANNLPELLLSSPLPDELSAVLDRLG